MNKRTTDLFTSLVGSSIDFSFKKKFDDALSIEKNIKAARRKIRKDVEGALRIGGYEAVVLLAELTSFYSKQVYYMAVRGEISMHRYRPLVLDYLNMNTDQRADKLRELLSKPIRSDKARDLKVTALGYFVSTYTGRLASFKDVLTREEFITIA